MYDDPTRDRALAMLAAGRTLSETSRALGISRAALREWRDQPRAGRTNTCPRTPGHEPSPDAYVELLGYYLGDGCISDCGRYHSLRISCDAALPGVVKRVAEVLQQVRPDGIVHRVPAPGAVVVQGNWKHWPCLFPQHGPGRKHDRAIVLEDWQRHLVEAHPGPFLRGLFHSDGSRVRNWATRTVAGRPKRYDYPRWQFTNTSPDIRELCTWALDLVGIAWRQSRWNCVSVSRREAVAALDALIGPKS
ncbi:transcriptional regulator [Nocardioides sp. SYSU D00038]|uniref:transcriptional regulator n=1 Tax=Nocardioides sp. SYSU D00038 TaxID=2812554 RepID=UPI0027DBF47B|nr:transcriptional regulator [Nocardioides sp. SYSU D00038]